MARPKAFFSSLYVVINDNNVNDILTEENKKYFKKIMSLWMKIRELEEYIELKRLKYSDAGDIYEFSVAKYWEDKYDLFKLILMLYKRIIFR